MNIFRYWNLLKYKAGQHDLACDATDTGKDYLDDGCTLYESVCVLMTKIEVAKTYISKLDDDEARKVLGILESDQDSDLFCFIPLVFGTDKN
jgi:hypothetical protein